jgi:glycosyltransferase involved in cell wall biosynthesis
MHVLMVSLSETMLTQTIGDTRPRHEAYAEQVGRISMAICNRRSGQPLPEYRSARVTARATESRGYLHYLSDGYRLGLEFHREQPIDLITSQDPFLTALIGLRLRRALGAPLIIQVNSPTVDNPYFFYRERAHNPALQGLARWTLRRADGVRVLSEGERQACHRHGVMPERVQVAYIPTDVSRFGTPVAAERLAFWRKRLGIPSDAPVAVWVGRPEQAFKDVPTLIQAFARVHREVPSARLVLVGEITSNKVPAQLESLGLSGVVCLPGAVAHTELPAFYQLATAYVHSSYYEGLGLVMVEASAAGLPVISTDTDGAREIVVPGKTGRLVPVGDVDALARELVDMFRHPDRARTMGQQARAHVADRFDSRRTMANWLDLWRSVVARAQTAGS